jgi:ribose 5-phosphate isomerase B
MRIAIGSDHAGFDYKESIKKHLTKLGHEVVDFGTDSAEPCDYPDFCHPAAEAVSTGDCERGIVLGGSGNGEAIVANRHPKVRCALCWNVDVATLSRAHNNSNMISIGQRMMDEQTALAIVDAWLSGEYEGGRHDRRIAKIDQFPTSGGPLSD